VALPDLGLTTSLGAETFRPAATGDFLDILGLKAERVRLAIDLISNHPPNKPGFFSPLVFIWTNK
jgi:hypothetical protein